MKTEKSQLKVGAVLSYFNMLVGNLIPLFYTPTMLDLLGQNEYGLYKLASSAASYLSLAAFGIGGAVTRYLIKSKTEGGKDAEEKMFGLFNLIFQIIAVITCLVGGIITCTLDSFYGNALTPSELSRMTILLLLLTVNTAIGFSASSYSAVVTSHERFLFLQTINIITTCIGPIVNVILLYMGCASIGMVISSLAINVLVRVIYIIYVRKTLQLRPQYRNMPLHLIKEVLTFSFWVFVANLVSQLYNATDTMIIGAFPALSTIGVAIYNVGAVFNHMVFSLAQAVSTLFSPRANKMVFSGASNKELSDFVIRVGRFQCLVITLVCSGFVAFGVPFINWYVGPEYADAYWVAVLMMIPSCIPLVQSAANVITQAKNKHQFRSIVYLFIAVINVIGTYFLVQFIGITGAALMTGLANIVGQGFLMNWYYWKKIGLDIPRFWKNILKIEWIPLLLCVITLILGNFIDFSQMPIFIMGVILYTTLYCLMAWKFAMNESEKQIILQPLKKFLKKTPTE